MRGKRPTPCPIPLLPSFFFKCCPISILDSKYPVQILMYPFSFRCLEEGEKWVFFSLKKVFRSSLGPQTSILTLGQSRSPPSPDANQGSLKLKRSWPGLLGGFPSVL